ncbi:MAG: AMP-dependent synthetase/ligase [Myxococcota bacterium]
MSAVVFNNLVEMFERSVEAFGPNRLFGTKVNGTYQWITYTEVGALVDAFRGGLASLGVGPGDAVAVIANNRVEWAVAAYATYGLGAKYVPMYEAQLPKEWKYILNDCGAKVLLAANDLIYGQTTGFVDELDALEHVVNFDGTAPDTTSFEGICAAGRAAPAPSVSPSPEDICGFIYTSGTTGNPKGVLLSHGNISSNINAVHQIFPMDQSDVSLSFLPWAHSFGQNVELNTLLSYGASLGLAENVTTIIANLEEVRPTLLFSVPRIFNRIYAGVHKKMAEAGGLKEKLFHRTLDVASRRKALSKQGKTSLRLELQFRVLDALVGKKIRARFGGRLRYAFSGGAALSKEVGEFVDNLGITVYEGYGLTETSPISTGNCPAGQVIGSVGRAIPGVEIKIDPVEAAPQGQGEIIVYGPNVMQGYHNLPEKTAEVMTDDGGFRTGDLGRLDSDGFLYITGRVKEQYKLENGKYVAPAPLEEQLKLSGFINQALIDGTNRPYNVALIVPDFETVRPWSVAQGMGQLSDAELCAHPAVSALIEAEIKDRAPAFKAYEVPKKFVLIAEEFSTENGMLTPKMSLKRRVIMAAHGDALVALYG